MCPQQHKAWKLLEIYGVLALGGTSSFEVHTVTMCTLDALITFIPNGSMSVALAISILYGFLSITVLVILTYLLSYRTVATKRT